ncbi:leucine_Rich Repeat (LRR)-containing protein [Hexamita inflata]|uniref:Leucine Rich Repeat (LRR)-containing protein n=1 Tax=Hexamita inflata TaxID=28002 RepID=A0AA86R5M0_9EUKA|nr:leucine Rich Repeat (LRR)-containing protein [Hexamita inflata]
MKNLVSLDLSINKLENVCKLMLLPNISELNISNNTISNLNEIQQLTSLKYLNVSQNNLYDVSQLTNLDQLQYLNISRNRVSDIQCLQNLNLVYLNVSFNNISDLFADAFKFVRTFISHNYNSADQNNNASYDKQMQLKYKNKIIDNVLEIQRDPDLKSFKFTDQFDLSELILINNKVSFERVPLKVRKLSVCGHIFKRSELERINGIEQMTQLVKLNISFGNVQDIKSLSNLVNLAELDISANQIQDISPLRQLQLVYLNASQNLITNITAVETMKSLVDLNLFNNLVSDISSLINLTQLEDLNLEFNKVQNTHVLDNHPNVQNYRLGGQQ